MKRLALAFAALSLWPAAAAAADGGPSPGVLTGWDGVLGPKGSVRYVALQIGSRTGVEAVRVRGGRGLLFSSLKGVFAVPLATQGGQAGGGSRDGRTLVLATDPPFNPGNGAATRFAVFDTRNLRLRRVVTLRGSFSYDALSPDGKTLYLIQYSQGVNTVRYRVRAFDLLGGRLLARVIADKRERAWGAYMRGSPVSRATTRDGGWVYTLYGKPDGTAFIHALDASHRTAVCVDLPWRNAQNAVGL